MLETKQQKQYLGVIIVLIVILVCVSIFNHGQPFKYVDTKNYSNNSSQADAARQYLAYLNTLQVDQAASKQLFESIISQDEIAQEIKSALVVQQPVNMPEVDVKNFKSAPVSNKQSAEIYLGQTVSQAVDFNNQSLALGQALFTDTNEESLAQIKPLYSNFWNSLVSVPVPADAQNLHKALVSALTAYGQLLNAAQDYDTANYENNNNIWPKVYQDYLVINSAAKTYSDELNKLTAKYKIAEVSMPLDYAQTKTINLPFVKTAHAFVGVGDTTIVVGDIPSIILNATKEGLRSAFVQFMGAMLNKLIAQIENNYMIANFLYYSDALVSGQYANDYLNKYVADNVDRQIIKRFIPQFSCGANAADLKPVFEAKAKSYLGFDPSELNPKDPKYFAKMASVGNFLASPSGWQIYYQDLADMAESQAEINADRELLSPGLKSARDIVKNDVAKSVSSIVSAQRASFTALLQLGAQNAEGIISGFVAQLTQTLINNFVFKGVTGGPTGGVGVLKEQVTCVAAAQIQPVLALSTTQYQSPGASLTPSQALEKQCSDFPQSCQNSGSINVRGGQ